MPTLDPRIPSLLWLTIETMLFLAVIVLALRRRAGQEAAAYLLSLYAGIALALQGSETAWRAGLLDVSDPAVFIQLHWYGALSLAFLLALILRAFLRMGGGEGWAAAGVFWLIALMLLADNAFGLPDIVWSGGNWTLPREQLNFGAAALGWAVFTIGGVVTARRAYRDMRQPLHRNRLIYWLPIYLLSITADMLFFSGQVVWGQPLRLVSAWLLAYVVVTHHLPDVRRIMRSTLIYVSTTLLVVLFYVAGFTFSQYAFQAAPGYNPLFIGAAIALLLALIFTPLLGLVERAVDRWLRTEQRDPSRTLREYSDSISNILDMERLATVAVGLIMEAMDIQRGFLFLVDRETRQGDQEYYRLRAVRSAGERPVRAGLLDADGPIARYLTHEQRPLLQFDLDLLPVYRKTHPGERRWLSRLNAEVYVPIFAKREWIGLFALGAKLSGARYTEKDLVTLGALAGQTAVALENARLVENLVRLNKEVRQAYRDLDKANRDLERLDRTKSDFISIASHELRTPLTVMRGYTEMLLENPSLDEGILQMVKGIHEGTLRLHEIMDSLFDIAQIDARTLQLHLQAVDVAELVRSVCSSLAKPIAERGQYLTIDLPAFPTIKADPNTLRKVFYHLATNAIKFTPNGGRIVVGGKTLPANHSDLPEGGVEIVISDTGVGVDPTFREIIFTKFYQPGEQLNKHSTGKTKFKGGGAGLGLALARGIVEAHGGKIWVESPGYDDVYFPGSHFHVVLPLRKQSESDTLPLGDAVKMKLSAHKK